MSFVNKLSQITDVTIPDVDLQWAPLPNLLSRSSPSPSRLRKTLDEQDTIFTVSLPGDVMHTCVLPGEAWESPAQRGIMIESVPFTHPAHVPAILDLLRHQCVINTLLRSCVTSQPARTGSVCDLHFEVLPESDTSFSVTFHPPDTESLAVLLVNVSDPHQITCRLFGAGTCDASMDEYVSTVMNKFMSVPVTLRTINCKLEELASAPPPPSRPTTTEVTNDQAAPSSSALIDTHSSLTELSQGAAVPEDGLSVSGSACSAMSVANSEHPPEINTSPPVKLYPFTPASVFSQ